MKREIIIVEGMSCDHCVKAVTRALKSVEGVTDAIVELKTKTAEVEFDESKTTLSDVKKAIVDEGYGVLDENTRRCWSCG